MFSDFPAIWTSMSSVLKHIWESLLGNKPPFTVPAKAKYGQFDRVRAAKYFGVQDFTVPDFFPILSLLVGLNPYIYPIVDKSNTYEP
jgi:hypothetical protein